MPKNIIIVILLLAVVASIGSTVYASYQVYTEQIVEQVGRNGQVYSFSHNGNRCYVVESRAMSDSHSISCVRFSHD